jgi:hypothetical protein
MGSEIPQSFVSFLVGSKTIETMILSLSFNNLVLYLNTPLDLPSVSAIQSHSKFRCKFPSLCCTGDLSSVCTSAVRAVTAVLPASCCDFDGGNTQADVTGSSVISDESERQCMLSSASFASLKRE